jgi:hypothetical protein
MIRATAFLRLCYLTAVFFTGAVISYGQKSAIDGSSADWKTGKSRDEALKIEKQRYDHLIGALDNENRLIYADYSCDRIACGNDYRTNAGCFKAAADRRDRRLALNNEIRVQANATHRNQIDDIYRCDRFPSQGGGNPSKGDPIPPRGEGNPS